MNNDLGSQNQTNLPNGVFGIGFLINHGASTHSKENDGGKAQEKYISP